MSTRKQRAELVDTMLNNAFPNPPIPLDHSDAFTLLVAVLLSAQCTDKRVNLVTPALFEAAPTPHELAKLSAAEIEAFIKTCGLYRNKAKALHGLANLLLEKHNGEVPHTFAELEALPGVGHKTASVVLSHAFKIPAFPVDTHIHRLAARWGLSNGKSVVQTEKDLKALFPKEEWERKHLQFIFYGRSDCTARGCDGTTCPICQAIHSL